uniref:Uncharacterized protein n=1 Tax=Panagrolaimus sp. PS1159 TaxID=55785 RepID=A0AC35ESP0_9BILA
MRSLLRQPDIELDTPLHNVARNGNIEIFRAIIKFYAEINLRNAELQTPLHIAATNGHENIAKQLLEVSLCSINLLDKFQATPLFYAIKNGSISMIKLLINNGANTLSKIDGKKIPLDIAITDGNISMVKLLLEELRDDEDENRKVFPLHDAVEKRQLKVLKSIIKRGYAVIDQINEANQTCLELAIETNFVEGVSYLLNLKHWERLMRRRFKPITELDPHPQSPMQLLITKMPQMAKLVLDKCVYTIGRDVYHNYEIIDDVYYIPDLELEQCKGPDCELNQKIRSSCVKSL